MRLLGLLVAVALGSAHSAVAAEMVPHRALYELRMQTARSGDVVGAGGKMAYEVIDACDGWATRQRLQLKLTNRDGQDIEMISDYVTWESKDGLRLRFHVRQTTDTAVTSETEGSAVLTAPGGAGEARYTLPRAATIKLPAGTLLPMRHTEAIIAAARDGKKFLAVPLFDGTSDKGAQDSSVAILSWLKPEATGFPLLSELSSARVHVAFFDRDAGTQQPDYEIGMRYWENGVADELQMDFGDFVMTGKLTDLTPQPGAC